MNRIWITTFFGILAGILALGYWTETTFGIWTKPEHNVWEAAVVLAFAVPTILLLYAWIRTSNLNDLIGKDYPGRAEKHFNRLTEILCRRWNGEATINLISLQLVSRYDLRKELMKRDNYLKLIKNLLRVNRFDFGKSKHSHIDCLDAVREVILETEVAHFKRRISDVLENIDKVFFDSASKLLKTELPVTLCILGYSNCHELIGQIMRIFDRLDPKQHNKLLSIVDREADLKGLPTTGRGENVEMTFPSFLHKLREKLAEKYIMTSA